MWYTRQQSEMVHFFMHHPVYMNFYSSTISHDVNVEEPFCGTVMPTCWRRIESKQHGVCVAVTDKLTDEFIKLLQQSTSSLSSTSSDADWTQSQQLSASWLQRSMHHTLYFTYVFSRTLYFCQLWINSSVDLRLVKILGICCITACIRGPLFKPWFRI